MAKMGRPTKYTEELADKICSDIAIGKSLVKILQPDDMPSRVTFYNWLDSNKDLLNKYARAKQDQADYLAEEIVHIADTEENPNKARVRVDARKWVASKLKPKSYGDKIDMTSGDQPISFTVVRGEAKGSDAEDSDA